MIIWRLIQKWAARSWMVFLAFPAFATAQERPIETLYSFTDAADGGSPLGGVTIGRGHVLYGTTYGFGLSGYGTVFSLTPPSSLGGAWAENLVHTFAGLDGAYGTSLMTGKDGRLYGTTTGGGTSATYCYFDVAGCGTAFSLTPPASSGEPWTENVLYSFSDGADGSFPYGRLVMDDRGVLYGTANNGGIHAACHGLGCGTVFTLIPPSSAGAGWMMRVLYTFSGGADGGNPFGSLVIGSSGVLYGTTEYGGASGYGTVFSLKPPRSPDGIWTETVLHTFNNIDGAVPFAGVAIGDRGVLYGTTAYGGASGAGTVFSLRPPTSGDSWAQRTLYSFTDGDDGGYPMGSLVIGNGHVLYGTASQGGASKAGVVFALVPHPGSVIPWIEKTLASFTGSPAAGSPQGNLVIVEKGVLYGTTVSGGTANIGAVFSLRP